MVLEKTPESPLDCKEIQPVHPKGNQSCTFTGRTDAEAETPVLWPPDAKSWLTGKDPDAGRDCGQEEKGTTENEMVGWHHWLDGHESEWTPGVCDGQGGQACCGSWGRRVGQDWATELFRLLATPPHPKGNSAYQCVPLVIFPKGNILKNGKLLIPAGNVSSPKGAWRQKRRGPGREKSQVVTHKIEEKNRI